MGLHEGRAAIVTGAAQGIGHAVAARLIAEGARVFMADIQAEKVEAAARRLDPRGNTTASCAVDVGQSASVARMVEAAAAHLGRIDILVNVAGGSGSKIITDIEDMTDEIWDGVINSNLRGTFLASRAVTPHMRKGGGGAIVNFATGSIRGFTGKTTSAARLAYVSAKAGIIGFTNQLSQDLAGTGVAVNVIQPGFVLTEPGARIRELFDSMPKQDQDAMLARRAPRAPEELGWAVAWLAAQREQDLTGHAVRLVGKIDSLDLTLTRDPENPLANTARLAVANRG